MHARLLPSLALGAVSALAVFAACTRAEDRAAKERIFSPEEPQGAQAEAAEKLDALKLGDDGALARRVLHMPRAQLGHRLQSYKSTCEASFAWQRGALAPDAGSPEIALTEESQITQSKTGDFFVRHTNARGSGWELVQSRGGVYLRNLPGPFRKRRTDRSDPEGLRQKAFLALSTFDRMARGLKLKLEGQTTAGGRKALRYSVIGAGARLAADDERDLPAVVYPEPPAGQAAGALGPDPDTARRLELFDKEQPVSVSGTLTVDAETAAPLAAALEGRFRVASNRKDGTPADLTFKVTLASTDVGAAIEVKPPAFENDPSTPHAVKDPLRFLGKSAAAGAASTAEPVEDDEPDAVADAPDAPADKAEKPKPR